MSPEVAALIAEAREHAEHSYPATWAKTQVLIADVQMLADALERQAKALDAIRAAESDDKPDPVNVPEAVRQCVAYVAGVGIGINLTAKDRAELEGFADRYPRALARWARRTRALAAHAEGEKHSG